jgi:hypothetical protein
MIVEPARWNRRNGRGKAGEHVVAEGQGLGIKRL